MAAEFTASQEITVNSFTADAQREPQAAALSGGGWVIVWESWGQDGEFGGVFGQRLDAAGHKVGPEFQINAGGAGNQLHASVEALAGGGFVVSWFSTTQDGNVQVFDGSGAKVGDPIVLSGGGAPDVAALGDGGFLVARLLGDDTVAQKFDAAGRALGSEFTVNGTLAGFQRLAALAGSPDGGAIAVWGQDSGAETGTFVQRFDATGVKVGTEVKISNAYPGSDVEVTGLAGGGYVVAETYYTYAFDGRSGNAGVKLIRLDSTGHALGETQLKAPASSGDNFIDPEVRGLADGGFVVGWSSNGVVYEQVFDAGGAPAGAEVSVTSGTHADVAAHASGAFLVVAEGDDVLARVFTPTALTLQGGTTGDDTITGGAGRNYLRGDNGDDVITGGSGFDDINGNRGADVAHGGAGDDWVVGGQGDDRLFGDDGGDIVYGNLGADTLDGGAGADLLRGGQGADVLSGGDGSDWLSGDRGDDTLNGGAGADVFHSFSGSGVDRVVDFDAAEGDRVQLDPGTAYRVAQVGADVVVSLQGGQVILEGVQLSSLTGGWIFEA